MNRNDQIDSPVVDDHLEFNQTIQIIQASFLLQQIFTIDLAGRVNTSISQRAQFGFISIHIQHIHLHSVVQSSGQCVHVHGSLLDEIDHRISRHHGCH